MITREPRRADRNAARGRPTPWNLALLVLVLAGCGPTDEAPRLRATPERSDPQPSIVSLTPLATRFVIAIGAAEQLVGVDRASAELPGLAPSASRLGELPVIDLAGARVLEPDVVLVARGDTDNAPERVELIVRGAALHDFAPHDLEDVLALCRVLGPSLVGEERARRFEVEISRPLAEIGGSSFGQSRPRVLAVVDLDPLVVAGGHSFETDLIEIAGGQSVTHAGAEPRVAPGSDPWTQFDPDLVLVMLPHEPSSAELEAAFGDVPDDVELRSFRVDAATFWLEADQGSAHRLRALIASLE